MNPYETRRIGVGVHTAAEVQVSFQEKAIKLVRLRFENGKLDDSYSWYIDVPWFRENESLEELGRKVLTAAEYLGLVSEGKTQAIICDMDDAVRHRRSMV
jgi:hypothetical protein